MVFFLLFESAIIFIILCLFVLLSWLWPPDSPWAPWWKTTKEKARIMCRLAKVSDKDLIYDLGCGNATALIIAAKEFGATGVGIEIDPMRYIMGKWFVRRAGVQDQIRLIKNTFYNEDISEASIIFVYLIPRVLKKLLPKFKKELKPGTLIVSYRYPIDLPLFKEDKTNEIFVYEIPKK